MDKTSIFFTFQQLIILCCFAALPLRASCSANSLLCRQDVSLHYHTKAYYTNGNLEQSRDSSASTSTSRLSNRHLFSDFHNVNNVIIADAMRKNRPKPIVEMIESIPSRVAKNLVRGAVLRIASGLSGGTPLECIKSRVTVTTEGPWEAAKNIVSGKDGIRALWTGTPARTVEHALQGALFLAGSLGTKRVILANGGSPTLAALCGGFVGGIIQTLIMTPAGMIFTSLNVNKDIPGYEHENAWLVTKRIMKQRGIRGMYVGIIPMMIRQSTKWATRAGLTEIARAQFQSSGILGELASGIVGGVGSCWNTPVETVRVLMHQDLSRGKEVKPILAYVNCILEKDGVPGLFRGVTPRCIQAVWLTAFMIAVPNVLGI